MMVVPTVLFVGVVVPKNKHAVTVNIGRHKKELILGDKTNKEKKYIH
jgi:hypothetical protein